MTEINRDDCWLYARYKDELGYGKTINGRAHRIMYESQYGPIPEGLELDHLCREPSCVNPLHLEAVTHRENNLRGKASALRHLIKKRDLFERCVNGHLYAEVGYQNRKRSGGVVYRSCNPCRQANIARSTEKRTLKAQQEGSST